MKRSLTLILTAAVLASAAGAQAKINLPTLPKISLPKAPPPYTNCVAEISQLAAGKGSAIGEYGIASGRTGNLRSDYIGPPTAPDIATAGARTPLKFLSKNRPDGVMVGAGYIYVPGSGGQESVQLNHIMIRAPYLAANGVARTRDPTAGRVRVTVAGVTYEGEGKIDDGGLTFYISASHPVETGYVQMRPEDQATLARAASSQTPIQISVSDAISGVPLYSATVAVGPGPTQKAMMDQALASAKDTYAQGYDSPSCHPPGVSID